MKNYGYIKDTIDDRDKVFGSFAVPFETLQENSNWKEYLPPQELQSLNGIEPYSCVPSAILKNIQTLIKRKYGLDRNYSERFLACLAETGKNGGSSPRAILQFLRKIGVPLDKHFPFDSTITTEDEYFSELTPKLMALAKEFTDEWDLQYDEVSLKDIEEALKSSPLIASVCAWRQNEQGLFYKPEDGKDNHLTLLYAPNEVYDTYLDSDGDAFKTLVPNYKHEVIKRFHIGQKVKDNLKDTDNWLWDIIKRMLSI